VVLALLLLLAASPTFEDSFRAGLLALQRNDLNAAESSLEAAAKLAPGNGRVWVALAQTYSKLREQNKADAAESKAAKLASSDPVALHTLAIYYSESGQTLKAARTEAKYAALVERDAAAREHAASLYFDAAQPLLRKQKFGEAAAILDEGRSLVEGNAQLELAAGVAYYGLRRFDDAAGACLRTIAISPATEQPYVFLGRFLDQIPARLPEVTKRFIEYENANPSSYLGYLLHAKALDAQSIEPETARGLLAKALAMNDRDASAHFELGTLLERTKRFADAAGEFERAAELDASDPATHYRLARVYDRLGRHEAARKERERHAELVKTEDAVR
jgi:Flp pilus assembly protein TadD